MKVRIRPAVPGDAAAITEFEYACFTHPWPLASVTEELENPCSHIFVAEKHHGLVGWAGVQIAADEGYILNVAVSRACRREGIGRRLVETLIELAKRENLAFLTLEMRRSNAPAAALYGACGFLPAGVRKGYYTRPDEDAVLMTVSLRAGSQTCGNPPDRGAQTE